ncbi:MAG TPA: hypothetical protein PLW57_07025, partial [Sphaerochaeta sp.]|nr:hypothetical protein [Sphaerochaeta sp.]
MNNHAILQESPDGTCSRQQILHAARIVELLQGDAVCRMKMILMCHLRFDHVLFNHFRIVSDQL